MTDPGHAVFAADAESLGWARAAHAAAQTRGRGDLRHGRTWEVGVDALKNAEDGSIGGVPLQGPWRAHVVAPAGWHAAQLSVIHPGYPGRDGDETSAQHRFRRDRCGAHVDGLLPIGTERRRHLREPHGFILGLPLTDTAAAPLMVWPGSHLSIGQALRTAIADRDPLEVDVTECYTAARRAVFAAIEPVALNMVPGQSVVLHRHLLHGVAPWRTDRPAPPGGRMIAYFRPQIAARDWLEP